MSDYDQSHQAADHTNFTVKWGIAKKDFIVWYAYDSRCNLLLGVGYAVSGSMTYATGSIRWFVVIVTKQADSDHTLYQYLAINNFLLFS